MYAVSRAVGSVTAVFVRHPEQRHGLLGARPRQIGLHGDELAGVLLAALDALLYIQLFFCQRRQQASTVMGSSVISPRAGEANRLTSRTVAGSGATSTQISRSVGRERATRS